MADAYARVRSGVSKAAKQDVNRNDRSLLINAPLVTGQGGVPGPATQMEAVFGASDGLVFSEGHPPPELESTPQDIATFHNLKVGPFSFNSRNSKNFNLSNFFVFIVFMKTGDLTVSQLKRTTNAEAGDILVFSTWAPFHVQSKAGAEAIIINVPAWWGYQNILSEDRMSEPRIPADFVVAEAAHLLARRAIERPSGPPDDGVVLNALAAVLRVALEAAPAMDHVANASAGGRFRQILLFMLANYGTEHLSPHDAATSLKCSLRTIHKACADQGTSFSNLLAQVRISMAAYMLASTDSRISEIAYSSGFSSLSHFCRLFKSQVGQSASKYRRPYHVADPQLRRHGVRPHFTNR